MSRHAFRLLSAVFISLLAVSADDKTKDTELQVLGHFVGSWKSEGKVKPPDGGDGFKITEQWTAKLDEQGELVIEGKRALNDGFPGSFRWTMIHNPTTDLLEAVHVDPDDPASAMRYEGTVTVDPPVLELRSGDSVIRFSFKEQGLTVINTEVRLSDESGKVSLEGTVTHKKEK